MTVRLAPGTAQPDRRVLRKLARAKHDSIEIDGKWWFRDRTGAWSDDLGEEEEESL